MSHGSAVGDLLDSDGALGGWVPYGDKGDVVCGGRLLLHDSKDRRAPFEVCGVGRRRRRHRSGDVAW